MKRVILWLFGVAALGITALGAIQLANQPAPQAVSRPGSGRIALGEDRAWVRGSDDAPSTLLEFSDFQCPVCQTFHPYVERLLKDFSGQITHVFYHHPLRGIHQNADMAAQAAEAAGRQGRFWEMHDLLFENQIEWSDTTNAKRHFVRYARSLQMNTRQFERDMVSEEIKERVWKDYNKGIELGVQGTPTFFLNGKPLKLTRTYEQFRKQVEDILREKN